MYRKQVLELADAEIIIRAIIDEATRNPPPVSVAVVDDNGDLISFARMTGTSRNAAAMAPRKAWTAALFKRDTGAIRERVVQRLGYTMTEFGSAVTSIPGGVVVKDPDGSPVGAIGVSGKPDGAEDERVAKIGLEALRRSLWPNEPETE